MKIIFNATLSCFFILLVNACTPDGSPNLVDKSTSESKSNNLGGVKNDTNQSMPETDKPKIISAPKPRLTITHTIDNGYVFKRSLPLSGISINISINTGAEDKLIVGPDYFWNAIVGSSHKFELNEFDYGKFIFAKNLPTPKDGFINYRQLAPKDNANPPSLPSATNLVVCFDTMDYGSISSFTEAWSFELPNLGKTVDANLESKSIEFQRLNKHLNLPWESQ